MNEDKRSVLLPYLGTSLGTAMATQLPLGYYLGRPVTGEEAGVADKVMKEMRSAGIKMDRSGRTPGPSAYTSGSAAEFRNNVKKVEKLLGQKIPLYIKKMMPKGEQINYAEKLPVKGDILAHEMGHIELSRKYPKMDKLLRKGRTLPFAGVLALAGAAVLGDDDTQEKALRAATVGLPAMHIPTLLSELDASVRGAKTLAKVRGGSIVKNLLRTGRGIPTYLRSALLAGALPYLVHRSKILYEDE